MTQVAQARLDGDRDRDKALIAETMKLIGNSSYDKLITNKEKHHDIVYVNESEIGAEIMDNHFYSLTELPNGYYEVEKTKQKIILDFLFTSVSSYSTLGDLKESPSLRESSHVMFSRMAFYTFSEQQPKAIEDKVCLHQS